MDDMCESIYIYIYLWIREKSYIYICIYIYIYIYIYTWLMFSYCLKYDYISCELKTVKYQANSLEWLNPHLFVKLNFYRKSHIFPFFLLIFMCLYVCIAKAHFTWLLFTIYSFVPNCRAGQITKFSSSFNYYKRMT